jgi:hypothetical protein
MFLIINIRFFFVKGLVNNLSSILYIKPCTSVIFVLIIKILETLKKLTLN